MTNDVFEDLVNLYLDKEINTAQLGILRTELERNSERRNFFESYCRMHQATHFAALTKCPVIPRLSNIPAAGPRKPYFFALNWHVWAAGLMIVVLGTYATVYFNGPFGSARIELDQSKRLEPIVTFATAEPVDSLAPLEFFRALKAREQNQNSSFVQELRHARATLGVKASEDPSFSTWKEIDSGPPLKSESDPGFDLEYSNYEFKR